MKHLKRLMSILLSAALFLQTVPAVYAQNENIADESSAVTVSEEDSAESSETEESDSIDSGISVSPIITDGVSDIKPVTDDDPSYLKYMANARKARSVWGSSNLVHQPRFANEQKIYGIDVSYYQGNIDWNKVKNSGIEFVIIRVGYRGYGSAGTLVEDPKFKTYMSGAAQAGLKVGVYFYTQAINTKEAAEEAQFVLDRIKGYQLDMPVYYDIESVDYDSGRLDNAGLSKAQKTELCKSFCNTVINAGYESGVYANKTWLTYMIDGKALGELYPIWLAHYTSNTDYAERIDMWQYTGSGTVSGISAYTDMNVWYPGSSAPMGSITLSCKSMTGSTAMLSWNSVIGASGYEVYRKNASGNVTKITAVTGTSASVTITADSCDYYVKAYREASGKTYYGKESNHLKLQTQKVINLGKSDIAQSKVMLKWSPVTGASGYCIYYAPVSGGSYKLHGTTNSTNYTVTGLSLATVYRFQVRAYFNTNGSAAFTSSSHLGPLSDEFVQGTKTNKVYGLTVTSATPNSITVKWNAIPGKCNGYQVAFYDYSTEKFTNVAYSSGTSYTYTGLTAGKTYNLTVRPYYTYNGGKIPGVYSDKLAAVTAPTKVSGIKSASNTSSSNTISWNAVSTAKGYEIYQWIGTTDSYKLIGTAASTTFTNSKKSSGTMYKYKVRAYNTSPSGAKQYGTLSDAFTTCTLPANAKISSASTAINSVTLNWPKVSKATDYQIDMLSNGSWKNVAVTSKLTCTVGSLSPNKTYQFRIRTRRNLNGTYYSGNYATKAVTISSPAKVSGIRSVSNSSASNTFSWNKVSSASGYEVYQWIGTNNTYKKLATVSSLSYTNSKKSSGTMYKYKIRAYTVASDGTKHYGPYSDELTTCTLPGTVKTKTSKATANSLTLNWNKTSKATSYQIFIRSGSSWKRLTSTNKLTYTAKSLSKGTSYTFRIRACRTLNGKNYYGAYTQISSKTK